ncbi:hypothetical protein RhiirA5_406173 [Rhizophagus irregularis]|uniref:Uncharacterized protein n=1 Tax=Rhizophagus irregularis TaxID=588596 RepID=A0A2N0QDI3_9GLOM|nr:hypothetical protein RhiirA5_406173 [Rhizophagus irregularis]
MAFRNLHAGSNRDTFSTPSGNRSKTNNVTKHTASNSKVLPVKKKQQHAPPKEIQSVMTGYDPVLKDNIWEITLYDIPSTWPQLEILQYFEKWSHMIAFKMKYQKKYLTVTISINFNKWAMNLWNQGVWTASLDPSNDPSQLPISYLGCKAFKLNLQEYEGVWIRYFSPQLFKGHNRPPRSGRNQKQNQNSANKVEPNTTDNKIKTISARFQQFQHL